MSRVLELVQTTPPTTMVVVLLCTVLYIFQILVGPTVSAVTFSPRLVMGLGDCYCIITSALYHGGFMHIAMNMMSMVAIGGSLEKHMGTLSMAVTILHSIIWTSVLYTVIAWMAFAVFDYEKLWFQHSVGFSGVLFHLSVLECHMGPLQPRNLFGIVSVSPQWYPWVLWIVLQFILPNLSFLGHLSGIVVGTLHLHGYLDWILPIEDTMRELDESSWMGRPCHRNTPISFVPTQSRTDISTNGGSIGETLRRVGTLTQQFFEAISVLIFGRGRRLNTNISFPWSFRGSSAEQQQVSSNEVSSDTVERTRFIQRESEMV